MSSLPNAYLQQSALIVLRHQVAQHSPVVDKCIQASVQLVDFRRQRRGESWSIFNFHSPGFDGHHSFRGASEGLELFRVLKDLCVVLLECDLDRERPSGLSISETCEYY